eukprot:1172072-Pyramimonas_sp.AAC.1
MDLQSPISSRKGGVELRGIVLAIQGRVRVKHVAPKAIENICGHKHTPVFHQVCNTGKPFGVKAVKIVKLAGPDRSLRAAAGVGSHGKSSSTPPEADGILTVTPDGPEAA